MTSINSTIINRKLLTRIFSKIKISTEHFYNSDPCWDWAAGKDKDGYGKVSYFYKGFRAHRFLYDLFVEPIPKELQCDHLCRRRSCVNPVHIEPVTPRVNTLRGDAPTAKNAAKTHCAQGHLLTSENVRLRRLPNGSVGRRCKKCQSAYKRRYNQTVTGKKKNVERVMTYTQNILALSDDDPRKIRLRENQRARCRRYQAKKRDSLVK